MPYIYKLNMCDWAINDGQNHKRTHCMAHLCSSFLYNGNNHNSGS